MDDEQKNGPNRIQDLTLPAYAMVNGDQVQLFQTIDEYALKTIKEQSAPVKIVVFTKRNMDNYDTIIYNVAEFLNEYPSDAMQKKINSALKLSREITKDLKQVQDAYNPAYEQLLSLNTNTIFSTNYDIIPLYTSWANAFAVIKGIINSGHIPDENKKYICLVKIKTTALYTILYAVKVNKYIEDNSKQIQSILSKFKSKKSVDIRNQIAYILQNWRVIYTGLQSMINLMKDIDLSNNTQVNNITDLFKIIYELTTKIQTYTKQTSSYSSNYNPIKNFLQQSLKYLTEINKNTNELVQDVMFYNKLIKNKSFELPKNYASISNTFDRFFKVGGKLRSRSPFRSRSSRKAK